MYNTNEQTVSKVIFENPTTKFHLLELARKTKLHPNTIINTLNSLEKKGLIKQEKKKHIKEVFGNKEKPIFNIEKRIFNLKQLYDSGIIKEITDKFSPEVISIVGSYSRGEDIEDSDIDLVAISKNGYSEVNLDNFEKTLNRKIHLLILTYKEMSKEFYINLINGIVLYGALNKK